MMTWQNLEIIALSMDAVHCHMLCRIGEQDARPLVGRAKKHAYHVMAKLGHVGPLWVDKCYVRRIENREHQTTVFGYILEHAENNAWIWTFREGVHWRAEGYRPPGVQ